VPPEVPIQQVQVDVREQWRCGSALRRTRAGTPLRANIAETILLAEFSEQGEKKDQRET
jgi:hypothetical protein